MPKIILTCGCFDVLHMAHVRLLQKAAKLGDKLIVLINSDKSVKRLKGPTRPINNQNDRRDMLLALKCVDEVIIQKGDDPIEEIKKIRPNIHVWGGAYNPERIKKEKEAVESCGGKAVFMEMEPGYSSTNIINRAGFKRWNND